MNTLSLKDAMKLAFCILICLLTGFLGSLATAPAIPAWYSALIKPAGTPPNWVFAPVWMTLYVLMGISLFLIVQKGSKSKPVSLPIKAFAIQLAFNLAWSLVFFGARSPVGGFAVIVLLWLSIIATIVLFVRHSLLAGFLLAPYILWVSYAAYLNFAIIVLNPRP